MRTQVNMPMVRIVVEEDGPDSLYLRGVSNVIQETMRKQPKILRRLLQTPSEAMQLSGRSLQNRVGGQQTPFLRHFVTVPTLEKGAQFRPESVPHFEIAQPLTVQCHGTDATELWFDQHESMADMLPQNSKWICPEADVFNPMAYTHEASARPDSKTVLQQCPKDRWIRMVIFKSKFSTGRCIVLHDPSLPPT